MTIQCKVCGLFYKPPHKGQKCPRCLENSNLIEVSFNAARNIIIMFLSEAYEIDNHLSDFIMSDEEVTELLDKIWDKRAPLPKLGEPQ